MALTAATKALLQELIDLCDNEMGPAITIDPTDPATIPEAPTAPHDFQMLKDADGKPCGWVSTADGVCLDDKFDTILTEGEVIPAGTVITDGSVDASLLNEAGELIADYTVAAGEVFVFDGDEACGKTAKIAKQYLTVAGPGDTDTNGNEIAHVDQYGNPVPDGCIVDVREDTAGNYLVSIVEFINKNKYATAGGGFTLTPVIGSVYANDVSQLPAGTIIPWLGEALEFTLDSTQCVMVEGLWSMFAANAQLNMVVEFQVVRNGVVITPWNSMLSGGNDDDLTWAPNDRRHEHYVPECFTLDDLPAGDYEIQMRLVFEDDSALAQFDDTRPFSVGGLFSNFKVSYQRCEPKK